MAQSHNHGTPPSPKQRSSRRRSATSAIAALVAGALISAHASAAPPDAQFSAGAGGASPILTPGSVSGIVVGDFPDSGGTDAAYATKTLTAHANGTADSRGGASSQATIVYYGEVVGPSATPIPLSIVGTLSASWGGGGGPAVSGGGADASMAWGIDEGFEMFGPGAGGADACSPAPCGSPSLVHVNAVFDVNVGQIFEVALEAQGSGTNGASYSVTADPEISILPDFLAENPGLSLEFSANITQPGSVDSVPEPSTWALLTLGFAALAFASHRRPSQARRGAGA
jgi:PEP-CTERM motif